MNWKRWTFTLASFAAVVGVSIFFIVRWWRAGSTISLPLQAHGLAIAAVLFEILTRSWKIQWSAKAAHIELEFMTALRTTLAGDFGASITPARSGAEPARFLVLAEAGVETSNALVVLYAELFLEALSLATVVITVAIVFRHAGVVLSALVGVVGVYAGFVIGLAFVAVRTGRAARRRQAAALGHSSPAWRQALDVDPPLVHTGPVDGRPRPPYRIPMGGRRVRHVGAARDDAALRAARARPRRRR